MHRRSTQEQRFVDPDADNAQLAAIEEGLGRILNRTRLLRIDGPTERMRPLELDRPS